MRMQIIGALALAGALAGGAALANELEDYCVSYTTETAGDPSGCSCLGETADAAVADELLNLEPGTDIESLSEASKAAIASCWPDAG